MSIILTILGLIISLLITQNRRLRGKVVDQTLKKETERILTNEKNISKLGDTFKSLLAKYRGK